MGGSEVSLEVFQLHGVLSHHAGTHLGHGVVGVAVEGPIFASDHRTDRHERPEERTGPTDVLTEGVHHPTWCSLGEDGVSAENKPRNRTNRGTHQEPHFHLVQHGLLLLVLHLLHLRRHLCVCLIEQVLRVNEKFLFNLLERKRSMVKSAQQSPSSIMLSFYNFLSGRLCIYRFRSSI